MVKVTEKKLLHDLDEDNLQQWLAHLKQLDSQCDVNVLEYFINALKTVEHPQALHFGCLMANAICDFHPDITTLKATIAYPLWSMLSEHQRHKMLDSDTQKLIEGATRMAAIDSLRQPDLDSHQLDKVRKMLLAMVEDVRVVMIKLAQQLILLRQAKSEDTNTRNKIASAAHFVYAPLANRLGLAQIKWEMEDLSFRYLHSEQYQRIAQLLDEKRLDRDKYIKAIVTELNDALKEHHIKGDVHGRAKHIYSIWRKMQRKNLSYHEIYDVRALRVLVHSIADCYSVLGIVHQRYQHIPKEFDDYIANPKENGYQSLHTAVYGPEGKVVEVQIRTHEMHEKSELGVASHWRYKEGVAHDASYEQKIAWLRQLLDWQHEMVDSHDDPLPTELFEERIYTFTPQGRVIDLPQGATPIDFAYVVHSQVGHRCRGAKVGGKMVPLNHTLQTGDQVEILTAKEGKPSRDWLNHESGYVKTSRARHKIQSWFKQQDNDKNLAEGKALIEREIERLDISPPDYKKLATTFNFKTSDQLFIALGAGDLKPMQLLHAIAPTRQDEAEPVIPVKEAPKKETSKGQFTIMGVGDLMTNVALCCKPVPGEPIIGYITQGRGVSVHRQNCPNLRQVHELKHERLIEVQWGEGQKSTYPVDLQVKAYDRHGLLHDITGLLAAEKLNVTGLTTRNDKHDSTVIMSLSIEVTSLSALSHLLEKITHLPNVVNARRIKQR